MSEYQGQVRRARREGWFAREEYVTNPPEPESAGSGVYTARPGRQFTPGPFHIPEIANPYGTESTLAAAFSHGWKVHQAVNTN